MRVDRVVPGFDTSVVTFQTPMMVATSAAAGPTNPAASVEAGQRFARERLDPRGLGESGEERDVPLARVTPNDAPPASRPCLMFAAACESLSL
jgi:hypothetical protein